jgi:ring-1,2-phenylacetyl-CoA epoxidase subunit PaaD
VSAAAAAAAPEEVRRTAEIWALLARIPDPEMPVLSIVELGIVRYVRVTGATVRVGLTPTYSACPATEVIRAEVREALRAGGFAQACVEELLAPPWSSTDLTEAGRRKLRAFGIAPPEQTVSHPRQLWRSAPIACPRCASRDTERLSEFGSTPCKAHHRCRACGEPFDYFKCL